MKAFEMKKKTKSRLSNPGQATSRTAKALKQVAYHEAGHVIAALATPPWLSRGSGRVTRYRIESVSILPRGRLRAHARIAGMGEQLGHDAVVSWAGYYAEKRIAPSAHWLGSACGDLRIFSRCLDGILGPTHDRVARVKFGKSLQTTARDLFKRPEVWNAVEALANRLIEKETIPGRTAEAIVQKSLKTSRQTPS